jgi:Rieske Fe-S protein
MDGGSLPSRRAVLAAPCALGAAAALGACSTYGGSTQDPPPPPAAPPAATTGAAPGSAPATGGAPAKPPLAKLADIPVGGGKIFDDQGVVVTRPQAGTVKGFSTACTHQGCSVTEVAGGTINCPCHGSKFAIADGSVKDGPAPRPLSPIAVSVDGDAITLA